MKRQKVKEERRSPELKNVIVHYDMDKKILNGIVKKAKKSMAKMLKNETMPQHTKIVVDTINMTEGIDSAVDKIVKGQYVGIVFMAPFTGPIGSSLFDKDDMEFLDGVVRIIATGMFARVEIVGGINLYYLLGRPDQMFDNGACVWIRNIQQIAYLLNGKKDKDDDKGGIRHDSLKA